MVEQTIKQKKLSKKVENQDSSLVTTGSKRVEFWLSVFFIFVSGICIVPILHIVSLSFSGKQAILQGLVTIVPVEFTLEAYENILGNASFISSFAYSVVLTLAVTIVSMGMTILCAYPLSKSNLKGRNIIMAFIVITMYFNPGTIPNYLTMKGLNLLDTIWVLILPGALSAYNMIILKSFFQGLDSSLYEAAYIDGASEFTILAKVVMPLTKPALATLSLFYAVSRWNGVSDVLFYVTNADLYTVQMKLKQMLDNITIANSGVEDVAAVVLTPENIKAASIVTSMIPMLLVYPFVQKYFTKGITLGGVKG